MADGPTFYPVYNTNLVCNGDEERDSCYLSNTQYGEADAIAAIRMVISCLSIMGAISIVTWAIVKKQVFSPKVHPIFVISLADSILGVLYIIGGWVWLRRAPSKVGCFAVSLPTVILECVTVNLTVVYALLAYSSIKRKTINNLQTADSPSKDRVWHPLQNLTAYLIAWLTPMFIVMVMFGSIAGRTNLVSNANSCSCFCLPVLGNVLPFVGARDEASAVYAYATSWLIFTYGLVLGTHYLIGFILLIIIYYKLLKYIKNMRKEYEEVHDSYHYGAMSSLLVSGQTKAKRRVLYFITVFLINGFFNFLLAYGLMIFDAFRLPGGVIIDDDPYFRTRRQPHLEKFYIIMLILQSLTVPLQGFLNALVYGWTRKDFLYAMTYTKNTNTTSAVDPSQGDTAHNLELEKSAEYSGSNFTQKEAGTVRNLTNGSRILSVRGRSNDVIRNDSGIQISQVDNETGDEDFR